MDDAIGLGQDRSGRDRRRNIEPAELAIADFLGLITVEQLEQMVTDAYGCDLGSLTSSDASSFIRQLQQAA